MDHVILFQNKNFRGAHKHVFGVEENLEDDSFNDTTSSIVVLEGTWVFFKDSGLRNRMGNPLGPGRYSSVEDFGIENDAISSLAPESSIEIG